MSYSPKNAVDERQASIATALDTRDSTALYQFADLEKEEGNDEYAEALLEHAKRIDDEDWAHDRERDNNL